MEIKNKDLYKKSLLLSIFILITSLLITSIGYKERLFLSYFKDIRVLIYNFIPIFLIIIIFAYILKSLSKSFLITSIVINFGAYVNYIKIIYREEPLYARDLFLTTEAFTMAKKYDLNLDSKNFLVFILAIAISIYLYNKLKDYNFDLEFRFRDAGITFIIFILMVFSLLFNFNTYHKIGAASGLNLWMELEGYQSKGFVYPFIYSIKSTKSYKYKNYNKKRAEEIYNSYEYKNIPEDKKINVVAIMLESFKDFKKYENEDMIFDKDPYEYFHKLQQESYAGNILVNSFGGGTFLTETNFLTGYKNTPRFDKKTISYPQYLKEQGYTNYAFHPNVGTFYNRKNVYPNLGFDKFYEYDETFKNINKNILMDNDFYTFIKEKFSEKEANKPYFYFGVTYQNHGPYTKDAIRDDQKYIRWNDSYSEEWYNYFNRYLSGIESSSNAMKDLVDYYSNTNEPTVLILFGDHSPSMGDNKVCFDMFNIEHGVDSTQGIINLYETPYIVWANNSAKNTLGKDFVGVGENLEAAFLMSSIFEYMGWEGNQYNQFVNSTRKDISILKESWFCINGEYTDKPNEESLKKIDDFKNMEYYTSHLLDKKK